MPPRQRGEILTEAVGERGRCHASGEVGFGGGLNIDIVCFVESLISSFRRVIVVRDDFARFWSEGYVHQSFIYYGLSE